MATLKPFDNNLDTLTGHLDPFADNFGLSDFAAVTPAALGAPSTPAFAAAGGAISVPAGGFTDIYAFGDSLSDAGNISFLTKGLEPAAPYSDGRFSSGNVWVQDLALDLGLPAVKASLQGGTDYAYGGAETGGNPQHTVVPTDLPSQFAQFALNVPIPSPNALYTVWAGSNDVLGLADSSATPQEQQAGVQEAANNEVSTIQKLISHGARNVVVLGVPDLSKTPSGLAAPTTAPTKATLAQAFNADLSGALQPIIAAGTAKIDYIDTYALLDSIIANPTPSGFTNTTEPLWTGNFTDSNSGGLRAVGTGQSQFVFFDGLHPTAQTHWLLGASVHQTLTGAA